MLTKKIVRINNKIKRLCLLFGNVKLVDISNLDRLCYTHHRLNMNHQGKTRLAKLINDSFNCKSKPVVRKVKFYNSDEFSNSNILKAEIDDHAALCTIDNDNREQGNLQ